MSTCDKLVKIYVGDNPNEINEDLITELARRGFEKHFPALIDKYRFHIERTRHPPPFIPRSPQVLIAKLNHMAKNAEETMSFASEEAAHILRPVAIMRFCILPEELESFVAYGERTSWKGLSDPALRVIKGFLDTPSEEIKRVFGWTD